MVYLLSVEEAVKYFGEEGEDYPEPENLPFATMQVVKKRIAYITDEVSWNVTGMYYADANKAGAWFTRSFCSPDNYPVYITSQGQFYCYNADAQLYIRPVIRITIPKRPSSKFKSAEDFEALGLNSESAERTFNTLNEIGIKEIIRIKRDMRSEGMVLIVTDSSHKQYYLDYGNGKYLISVSAESISGEKLYSAID
jgi:hypothetical protein